MKFGIGQPMRRHEDLRLITGRGRYTDDIILPRMTHAFVLRSPVAHAHIKRVDVAETSTAARDAAEAIDVEYEPLPAITEAKDAISPGAPQLFDHIPSNIVFDWDNDMGDGKATDAAFSRAARVATLELVNNRVVVNSMEPRNAIADFDQASGRSTLYTATQGPHFVRDPLAEAVLKIPKDMLRLITPNVG